MEGRGAGVVAAIYATPTDRAVHEAWHANAARPHLKERLPPLNL